MNLTYLRMENFRLHRDTEIGLLPGMTGVVGTNESGKSTITEAITWALYGSKGLRNKMSTVRWRGAPERHTAKVTLLFTVAGRLYKVERSEGGASIKDVVDSESVIAKGTAAVDEYIPNLVGMDLAEFRATYLCEQKDLARLLTMKGTARKQFILGVLGVGKIDDALAACRSRKNELASTLEGMETTLGLRPDATLAATKASAETAEADLQKSAQWAIETGTSWATASGVLAVLSESKERHVTLANGVALALGRGEAAHARQKELEEQLAEVDVAAEFIELNQHVLANLPDVEKDLGLMKAAQDKVAERARQKTELTEKVNHCIAMRARLEELNGGMAEVPELDKKIEDMAQSIKDRQEELDRIVGLRMDALESYKTQVAGYDALMTSLEQSIQMVADAGDGGECPLCRRTLAGCSQAVHDDLDAQLNQAMMNRGEAHNGVVDHEKYTDRETELADAIKADTDTGAAWQDRRRMLLANQPIMDELDTNLTTLVAECDAIESRLESMGPAMFNQPDLDELQARYDGLLRINEDVTKRKVLVERKPELDTQMAQAVEATQKAQLDVTAGELDIKTLGFNQEQHDEATAAEGKARGEKDTAENRRVADQATLDLRRENVITAEKAVADWDAKAEGVQATRTDLGTHTTASSRLAEFRTAMASTIRPDLEELASGFIQILTDGRHEGMLLSEDFEAILMESGVESPVVSGGAEDLTALAVRLAISQMIAERAGHPLSLMILDEPMGSLDDVRRENVLALLDRLRGTFDQVLVITHVPEVKDRVDHLVECRYDPDTEAAEVTVTEAVTG